MQGDRVKKWMFCCSDNVDKELKYNQYRFISSIDSQASHPKEHCCSGQTSIQSLEIVWRRSWWPHCKVSSVQEQPNQRGRPQSITGMVEASRVFLQSSSSHPSASCFIKIWACFFCRRQCGQVTPRRAKLNPEKVEDLVVVKCNLRLGSISSIYDIFIY